MYDNLNRLLYINTGYEPSIKGANESNYLQALIRETIRSIEMTSENQYEIMVRKQGLANNLRDKIHIVRD